MACAVLPMTDVAVAPLLGKSFTEQRWCCAAVGLTIYMVAQQLVLNYCRRLRHFESLYFASVANNILWWTFVKACFNVVWGLIGGVRPPFSSLLILRMSRFSDTSWIMCLLYQSGSVNVILLHCHAFTK